MLVEDHLMLGQYIFGARRPDSMGEIKPGLA